MPLFTVLLTRIFLGVQHSWLVYFSLLPIVLGVAVATVTEISFDMMGLLSALMATAGFAIITIYSKKALKDTGMHHLRLLHKLGVMAAFMFFPVWLLVRFSFTYQTVIEKKMIFFSLMLLRFQVRSTVTLDSCFLLMELFTGCRTFSPSPCSSWSLPSPMLWLM